MQGTLASEASRLACPRLGHYSSVPPECVLAAKFGVYTDFSRKAVHLIQAEKRDYTISEESFSSLRAGFCIFSSICLIRSLDSGSEWFSTPELGFFL